MLRRAGRQVNPHRRELGRPVGASQPPVAAGLNSRCRLLPSMSHRPALPDHHGQARRTQPSRICGGALSHHWWPRLCRLSAKQNANGLVVGTTGSLDCHPSRNYCLESDPQIACADTLATGPRARAKLGSSKYLRRLYSRVFFSIHTELRCRIRLRLAALAQVPKPRAGLANTVLGC